MKLSIDTTDSEKIIIELDGKREVSDARVEKSQKLLTAIKDALSKKNAKLSNLTEIEVNTGPGSFTGLRVGISVANALGWALKVPVNGQLVDKAPVDPVYQ